MTTIQPYSLDQTLADYGIQTLGELGKQTQTDPITTGIPELDGELGAKGIPRQALILLRGMPTAATTTISYHIIAQAQKQGDIVAYVDCCHTFDGQYATKVCGVLEEKLLHVEPDNAEHGLAVTRDFVSRPYRGLLVVDMGLLEANDGSLAKTFSKSLRAIQLKLHRSAWTLVLLLPLSQFPFCDPLATLSLSFTWTDWLKDKNGRRIGYTARISLHSRTRQLTAETVSLRLYRHGVGS